MTSSYSFLSDEQVQLLMANGLMARASQERGELFDPLPIAKLFTPDAGATWLLTEIDPDTPSMAFGLADLGLGCPEMGFFCLDELAEIRGPLRLPIEQDAGFCATQTVSAYAAAARAAGRIQA